MAALAGLLWSRALVMGTFKPFGIASVAGFGIAVPGYVPAAVVGVVAGSLLPGAGGRAWPYVAAALALGVLAYAVGHKEKPRHWMLPMLAAVLLVAARVLEAARWGITPFTWAAAGVEGILAGAGVYVIADGLPRVFGLRSGRTSADESVSLALMVSMTAAGLPPIGVVPWREALIAGGVMGLAGAGGLVGGSVAGLVVGAAGLWLLDLPLAWAMAQAAAGVAAGFLQELGWWAGGLGYVLAEIVVLFSFSAGEFPLNAVAAGAAGYFGVAIWHWGGRRSSRGSGGRGPTVTEDTGVWEKAALRIGDFGHTFSELAAAFEETLFEDDGHALASAAFATRRMVLGQMKGLAAVLESMRGSVQRHKELKEKVLDQSRAVLADFGLAPGDVSLDGDHRPSWVVQVRGRGCADYAFCRRVVLPALEARIGVGLQLTARRCTLPGVNRNCEFAFSPAPRWQLRYGACQVAADGHTPGDSFVCGELDQGRALMVVSDGMGIGPAAARESRAAVTLVQRLLAAGLDVKASLQAVNSLLILGEAGGDTFATLDLILIDTYTGLLEFAKIAAPPAYLVRGGKVQSLAGSGLPLGVVSNLEASVKTLRISPGDVLVMASDGLWNGDDQKDEWVKTILSRAAGQDPQMLAELLVTIGQERSGGKDDITVLVGRVEKVFEK